MNNIWGHTVWGCILLDIKVIDKLEDEIDTLRTALEEAKSGGAIEPNGSSNQRKSVNSLLEDLSMRENQIFEKEEELFELQDQINRLLTENQKLKDELSQFLNKNFSPEPEPHTIEEKSMVSAEALEEAKNHATNLQERIKMQDAIIEKLNEQNGLLKTVSLFWESKSL